MASLDLSSASPEEIYEGIRDMEPDEFEALMDDPDDRHRVIAALVDHMARLFRPEKADDVEAVVHVKLWDRPGGGYDHFEMVIADGTCTISAEPGDEADVTLKTRPVDLRKMLTGETGPRRLALRRRLTVLGDLRLGAKLPDLFAF